VGDIETPGPGGDDGSNTDPGGSNNDPGGSNNPATARVDVSVDKATVSTELKTVNPITVTIQGSGGFSGDVGLTATIVDANQAPIAGWTVDLSVPSVTLAKDGTSTAVATVHVPSLSTALSGTLKVAATSSATLGTPAATSAFTAADQVTFAVKYDAGLGDCVYPADGGSQANPVKVTQATKIRFFNTGTGNIVIHSGGPISHQNQTPNGLADPITEPNTAYEQTPTKTGLALWYCHSTPAGGGKDPKANSPGVLVQ
jgi:hypothetical protein